MTIDCNELDDSTAENDRKIASAFVYARRRACSLAVYPGERPKSLAEAYDIQDRAILLWGEEIVGWKVGRVIGQAATELGVDRLVGPIFKNMLWNTDGNQLCVPVFRGGFAAIEGEVVAILGRDAPADKLTWSREEALAVIQSLHAGVEIASSPYAGINRDGPLVTISDFGNNLGAIAGDEIPNWRALHTDEWVCRTTIDSKLVGEKSAAAIPGGPIESLRFLLENTCRRGRPLRKGMAVCTGAVTGVHQVAIGQSTKVEFVGASSINCRLIDAAVHHHRGLADRVG